MTPEEIRLVTEITVDRLMKTHRLIPKTSVTEINANQASKVYGHSRQYLIGLIEANKVEGRKEEGRYGRYMIKIKSLEQYLSLE